MIDAVLTQRAACWETRRLGAPKGGQVKTGNRPSLDARSKDAAPCTGETYDRSLINEKNRQSWCGHQGQDMLVSILIS